MSYINKPLLLGFPSVFRESDVYQQDGKFSIEGTYVGGTYIIRLPKKGGKIKVKDMKSWFGSKSGLNSTGQEGQVGTESSDDGFSRCDGSLNN